MNKQMKAQEETQEVLNGLSEYNAELLASREPLRASDFLDAPNVASFDAANIKAEDITGEVESQSEDEGIKL